jgi:hypothetical protein
MNDTKDTWQRVDAIVQQFEEAWQNGGRPAIGDYLPDGPDRLAVLRELIAIDLQRRQRAGEPVRLVDYVERFPEVLAADPLSITGPPNTVPGPFFALHDSHVARS